MTVNRNDHIKLPIWLISILLPLIVAGVVAYGVMTAGKATFNEKTLKNEKAIEQLQQEKVDRNEMNYIINSLQRIESKLDSHISQKQISND